MLCADDKDTVSALVLERGDEGGSLLLRVFSSQDMAVAFESVGEFGSKLNMALTRRMKGMSAERLYNRWYGWGEGEQR